MNDEPRDEERVSSYLNMLSEETMRRAWGDATDSERIEIALAAVIFQRLYEEREAEVPDESEEPDRFLLRLMNDTISAFAATRDISIESAVDRLSKVSRRQLVFEFNEAIEVYERGGSETLDEILSRAVEERSGR